MTFVPAKRILVPIYRPGNNGGIAPSAERLVRYAAALARDNEAEVHLLHAYVAGAGRGSETEMRSELSAWGEAELTRLSRLPVGRGLKIRTAVRPAVAVYHAILSYAHEEQVDRIVMGSHGRSGLLYVLLGSVAGKVVRHAPCPVLIIKRDQRDFVDKQGEVRLRRILCPLDGSERSAASAPLASSLARGYGADLLAMQVVPAAQSYGPPAGVPPMTSEDLKAAVMEAFAPFVASHFDAPQVEPVIETGAVVPSLVEAIRLRDIDLVVVASHGRDSIGDHLIGSVAERLVRLAPCAVCVVREAPKAS